MIYYMVGCLNRGSLGTIYTFFGKWCGLKSISDALASANSVLEVIDGVIYEVFADGTKKKIKDVPSQVSVDMYRNIEL